MAGDSSAFGTVIALFTGRATGYARNFFQCKLYVDKRQNAWLDTAHKAASPAQ
jgi:hypothetical protein